MLFKSTQLEEIIWELSISTKVFQRRALRLSSVWRLGWWEGEHKGDWWGMNCKLGDDWASWRPSEDQFSRRRAAIKCVSLMLVSPTRDSKGEKWTQEKKLMKNQGTSTWETSGAFGDITFDVRNKVCHFEISTSKKEAQCLVELFECIGGLFLILEFFSCRISKWHERPPALREAQTRKFFCSRFRQEHEQTWHLSIWCSIIYPLRDMCDEKRCQAEAI